MGNFYLILLPRSIFFCISGCSHKATSSMQDFVFVPGLILNDICFRNTSPSPVSPPRKLDGLLLTGLYYIGRECFSITFDKKFCYSLEAKWSRWGTWSVCTKTCGNGTRIRNRTCVAQNQLAVFAPIYCAGKALQEKKCAQWNCPGEQ